MNTSEANAMRRETTANGCRMLTQCDGMLSCKELSCKGRWPPVFVDGSPHSACWQGVNSIAGNTRVQPAKTAATMNPITIATGKE